MLEMLSHKIMKITAWHYCYINYLDLLLTRLVPFSQNPIFVGYVVCACIHLNAFQNFKENKCLSDISLGFSNL